MQIFPIGSPLVTDTSNAILNVTESEIMMKIEKKWLGNESGCSTTDASFSSNSLALESFWGLFMIVGIVALLAFVIYMVRFLHQNWHLLNRSHRESTTIDKILELIRSFYNKDLSYHAFNKVRSCCGCDCTKRVVAESSILPASPILPSPEQQNEPRDTSRDNI